MTKAIFYIKDKVQEVGYRTFIIEKILDSDLEGTARNLPDGRVKVLLEGEKEHIIDFIKQLKKEKPELAKNPIITKLKFDDSLIVPNAMRSSQALLAGQFSKAVVHIVNIENKVTEMTNETREGFKRMDKNFEKLPERIANAIGKYLKR